MSKRKKKVYVLHGYPDRNRDELVCMFFDSLKDVRYFKENLPGKYSTMILHDIELNDFSVSYL